MQSEEIAHNTPHGDPARAHPEASRIHDQPRLSCCGERQQHVELMAQPARSPGDDPRPSQESQREAARPIPSADRVPLQMLPEAQRSRLADAVHRPFFLAAIAIGLTGGAAWGVSLLWKIANASSIVGVTVHEVNAHGHAQITGWVTLFIMGFAYQAFPRMWRAAIVAPRLTLVVLVVMLASIAARVAGMAMHDRPWAGPLHGAGSIAQVGAVSVFVWQLTATFLRGRLGLTPSVGFVLAALAFMLVQSVVCGWHSARLIAAPDRGALLEQIATYQAPLRYLQLHGMAMLMIFGVGLRVFPAVFGWPEIRSRRAWWALGLLGCGVALEVVLFLAFRWTQQRVFAATLLVPWFMLPFGAMLVLVSWRPWRATQQLGRTDRSAKFVRAAFLWLLASLLLQYATPLYLMLHGSAFSHAYHGAVRHALTVGFITMMIMGVAAKVVPTHAGVDTRTLSRLWGPFVLVNAGCALRVIAQIGSDWWSGAFSALALSGSMELAGITWWAAGLASIMWRGQRRSVTCNAHPGMA